MKQTVRIPDPNEPQRFPDGEIAGPNGPFYFWLGSDDEVDPDTIVGNVDEFEFDFDERA